MADMTEMGMDGAMQKQAGKGMPRGIRKKKRLLGKASKKRLFTKPTRKKMMY